LAKVIRKKHASDAASLITVNIGGTILYAIR